MKMNNRLLSIVLSLLLSACANSPSVQYYVLEPLAAQSQSHPDVKIQHTIGIGPIAVPDLLESKKIVTHLTDNTVQIAQFHQWASPLQDNLLQTLTRNVAMLQPNAIVRAYPWAVYGTVDLQVIIDIVRFDTSPGKSVDLEANWVIKNEKTNAILKSGRSVIIHPLAGSSYPGAVHALSMSLGEFSQALSLALMQIP